MHYYGTRLSENISRREPEGYLLCLNVPVARTGVQEYLPEELGMTGGGSGPPGLIPVQRPEEEVFAPETMASFEAMPVTNDHPPDGVDISNIRALQKGHVHNVRRGSGAESDLLLADLIITDPVLIELILGGKREISCGYTYELHEENGKYIQRKIRGNHVAVVDAGRAGARVSIRDREPAKANGLQIASVPERGGRKNNTEPERRTKTMKKSLSKILARMAKDGDIETVAEFIEEMIEPEGTETPAETVAETIAEIAPVAEAAAAAAVAAEGETNETNDEATMADIVSRLDRIIELLTPGPASDEDPVEEIAETVEEAIEAILAEEGSALPEEEIPGGVMPEEVAEIMEEILEPAAGEVTPEESEDEDEDEEEEKQKVIAAGDANRAKLRKARKKIAKMPKKQQDRAYAEIYDRLRKNGGLNGTDAGIYAALAGVRRKPGRGNPADLGKKIMAKRNINCSK